MECVCMNVVHEKIPVYVVGLYEIVDLLQACLCARLAEW